MTKQKIILEAKREEVERIIEKYSTYYNVTADFLNQLKSRSIYLARKIRELE